MVVSPVSLRPPPAHMCCCHQKSVDPKVARTSVGGLYSALVASFTASTIQTAGQITLGLHMGNLLKVGYASVGWVG